MPEAKCLLFLNWSLVLRLFHVAFVTISAKGHGIIKTLGIKIIRSKNMVLLIQYSSLSGVVYDGTQQHMYRMCIVQRRGTDGNFNEDMVGGI